MYELFEFGELYLPVDGGAYCFQKLVQQKDFLSFIGPCQGVFQQQVFIGGGGDFGAEDGIIAFRVGLGLAAEVAVQ